MKISGFTIVRNADKYYFPIKESICSILPLVDEFIVALGDNSPGDRTEEMIRSIDSDKIKIIDRVWDEKLYRESKILAHETNFALNQCSGDWCFYIQADEVFHENGLSIVKSVCERFQNDEEVDGFLFDYLHFFGDYNHLVVSHGWYKNEIRLFKNNRKVYSIGDAQSFRKAKNEKLNVVPLDVKMFHYGWVRPPELMQSKKKEHDSFHEGIEKGEEMYRKRDEIFDYGPLGKLTKFKGNHPKVMKEFISNISWINQLNFSKKGKVNRPLMKHEKTKYKVLSFLENHVFHRPLFDYSNWNIIKR